MVVPRLLLVGIGSIVAVFVFHYIDKHFCTDSLGTIAHHVHGAWQSTRGAARAEYDDFTDSLDKARRARDRYRDWRGRGSSDGASIEDHADTVEESTPGFDVVKHRPGRRLRETAAWTASSSAPEVATVATRGGTAAEAGVADEAAAGVAAGVVAPEVAIPAAAVAATAHHLRKRQSGSAPTESTPTPAPKESDTGGAPADKTTNPSAVGDTSDANLALPTVSARPGSRSHAGDGASAPADVNSPREGAHDVEPTGRKAPPIERQQPSTTDEQSHAALEFPSTPPSRTSTGKGE
jgi:hypothetical protein